MGNGRVRDEVARFISGMGEVSGVCSGAAASIQDEAAGRGVGGRLLDKQALAKFLGIPAVSQWGGGWHAEIASRSRSRGHERERHGG